MLHSFCWSLWLVLVLGFLSEISTSTCVPGENLCQTCENSTHCQTCMTGAFEEEGQCEACLTGCATCSSDTICLTCLETFVFESPKCTCQTKMGVNFAENKCVACSDPKCLRCFEDYTVCIYCDAGYGLNNGLCVPCADTGCRQCPTSYDYCENCNQGLGISPGGCVQCEDANCLRCDTNYLQCTSCVDSYGPDQNFNCIPCTDSNCLKCSQNASICTECSHPFGVFNQACVQCLNEGCIQCAQNYSICTKCTLGKRLNNGVCTSCSHEKCLECNSNVNICTLCDDKYGVYEQRCHPCYELGCIICAYDYRECTRCIEFRGLFDIGNGYKICRRCNQSEICIECDFNTSDCKKCTRNYGVHNGICVACYHDSCVNCETDYQICHECSGGFGVNEVNDCQDCQQVECLECDFDYKVCTFCDDYFGVQDGACVHCEDSQCFRCGSDSSICTECLVGFGVKDDICVECEDHKCAECAKDYQKCTRCSAPGYGVSADETCQLCSHEKCLHCPLNVDTCELCDDNFGVSEGTCVPCTDEKCIKCALNADVCTECAELFGVSEEQCISCVPDNCHMCSIDANVCVQCVNAPFALVEGECIPCSVEHCIDCHESVSVCLQCENNGLVGLNNNECVPCDSSCLRCSNFSPENCTACATSKFLSENRCHPCSENCIDCDSETECNDCAEGFFVKDKMCLQCPISCKKCLFNNQNYESGESEGSVECTECQPHFELSSVSATQCTEICGDSWTHTYPCDNHKGVPFDGCDDNCTVMEDFHCSVDANFNTECTFVGLINADVTDAKLDNQEGTFSVDVKIEPPLFEFSQMSAEQLLSVLNISDERVVLENVTYNLSEATFHIRGRVDGDIAEIENTVLNITFEGYNSENVSFTFADFKSLISQEIPTKLKPLMEILNYTSIASTAMNWLSVILQFVSMTPCSFEPLVTVQSDFFVLKQLNESIYIPQNILNVQQYSNGFNANLEKFERGITKYFKNIFEDTEDQENIDEINQTNHRRLLLTEIEVKRKLFLNNFNLSFAFILLPILFSIFCVIRLHRFKSKNPNLAVTFAAVQSEPIKELLGLTKMCIISLEILLFGTMISVVNFIASATDFLRVPGFHNYIFDFSMTISGFILYLSLFIFFALKISLLRYTVNSFKGIKYIHVYLLTWMLIIFGYIIGPIFLQSKLFVFVVIPCAMGMAFALILRPFKTGEENVRYCLNLTLITALIAMRTFAEYHFEDNNDTFIVYLLIVVTNVFLIPIVQILNIAIGVLYVRRHCFNKNVECVCGAELQPNECFECIEKKEYSEFLENLSSLEQLGVVKDNLIVTVGKKKVSDLDLSETACGAYEAGSIPTEHNLYLFDKDKEHKDPKESSTDSKNK